MSKKQISEDDIEITEYSISKLNNETLVNAYSFIEKLLEYRKLLKLRDTYTTGVKEAIVNSGTGKIYVEYRLDGTVTGRLSNAAYKEKKDIKLGVSFHTLPRESKYNIRDQFVAPIGNKFITIDKKAMELRVAAHLANENKLIQAFRNGEDPHLYSAAMTFNKDPKDISKDERQMAKEVSFLVIYGGTAITLAAKKRIPFSRAESIIDGWFSTYPKIKRYMEDTNAFILKHGYAESMFGRRRNLPNVFSKKKSIVERALRQGLNFTVQSPASDILVLALIGINNELKNRGLYQQGCRIVATVHDSIELICPEHLLEQLINICYDQMINYPYMKEHFGIDFKVPFAIEILVGTSFGDGKDYHIKNS